VSEFRVLVTDRFDADAFAKLASSVNASRSSTPDLASDLANNDLAQIEGLVIRSRTRIDTALLARAPKLRAIVTCTSGFDHIDLGATEARGVRVMYTPNANAASAAELTWALVLACARDTIAAHERVSAGDWTRKMGTQLSGKTYGVVGHGRIGSRVAQIARAFGMNVRICDPYKNGEPLEAVLAASDVVSVHVPATAQTHHMIKSFEAAKPGLIFVNTSRGSVVEERVLVDALDRNRIAAAGLDVFETEPLPQTSELLHRDNVVLSPHVGASTHEAFRQASLEAAEKMIAFARHGTVTDELPGSEPWMTTT
jgi:D-3-phosphoglycerate dehydrogenase